jgi:Flp pilus assembly protein TadD/TolB-like protein
VPDGDSRPAGRRVRVRRVVVCLALIAWLATASLAAAQTGPPAVPVTTPASLNLVIPFNNESGEPRIYWLSEGSAILLTDDLGALGVPVIRREDRLRAFERLRVPPVAALSHATVIRLGQVVGAAQVVIGSFQLDGQNLIVRARTIRLDTGRMSAELIERGPLNDLLSIYERLARRVAPANVPDTALTRSYPTLPAFEQYIKGLLAEAPTAQIGFLTQAIKLYPGFQRARVALWDVHTTLGDHKEALAIAKTVPASSPLSRQARFLAGVSMINLGQHQAAFDAFTALNRDRPDPALLNNLGVVQLRRPRSAGQQVPGGTAVSYFGEAVKLDGSDPDLFFNLGYAYWLNRDMPGAIHWLREAVRRNPADDEAHNLLGAALQTAGNAAEAAREKELAKQLGVNAATNDLERLKLDIDVADSLRVASALVAAEQRDQRDIAAFHLEQGRQLFAKGRDDDAMSELRRTIFLAPYESEAHLLLARIYLRTGRMQDAIDALTIAVWSDPASTEARELLESLR